MKKQILSEEFRRMQKLAGIITENVDEKFNISNYKEEALSVLNDFTGELEGQGFFEFIPDLENYRLENYKVDNNTNSLYVEEFGAVYLVPNEGPIPSELEEYMSESSDGEANENGASWKRYNKNGYYYVVVI
jgi:hypothetical protein